MVVFLVGSRGPVSWNSHSDLFIHRPQLALSHTKGWILGDAVTWPA